MQYTTQKIRDILADSEMRKDIEAVNTGYPELIILEVRFSELKEAFYNVSNSLIQVIDTNNFEILFSFHKRVSVNTYLTTIRQSLINLRSVSYSNSDGSFNAWIEGLVSNIIALIDFVDEKLILKSPVATAELKRVQKEHAEAARKYKELTNYLSEAEGLKNNLLEYKTKLEQESQLSEDVHKAFLLSVETSNASLNRASEILSQMTLSLQEAEDKKLKISTFHTNVEEYEVKVNQLIQNLEAVLKKDEEVTKLISEARTALSLKTAQGISAAFASQYIDYSENKKPEKWLWGAGWCLFAALGLTVWLVAGWGISDAGSIGSIIGRIVGVSISIAGASFCASQYIKQRNIIEDYAYKTVLSKSIVAFKEEIAKGTTQNYVSEYLNQVLKEIHKDPLRPRGNEKSTSKLDGLQKALDQILEKLPSKPQ